MSRFKKLKYENNKSFEFQVREYCNKTKTYTLYNPHTQETKVLPKEDVERLLEEQKKK